MDFQIISAGIFFVFGLLLAGSDGPFFPWPNLVGTVLLGLAALISNADTARHRGGQ